MLGSKRIEQTTVIILAVPVSHLSVHRDSRRIALSTRVRSCHSFACNSVVGCQVARRVVPGQSKLDFTKDDLAYHRAQESVGARTIFHPGAVRGQEAGS
jgi:hypothetical protein